MAASTSRIDTVLRRSNYDKFPHLVVPGTDDACVCGWPAIGARLSKAIAARGVGKTILAVECYVGVNEGDVLAQLAEALRPTAVFHARDAMQSADAIHELVRPFLGGNDPVFGFLCGLKLPQFFDPQRIQALRGEIDALRSGLVLIVGCGATLLGDANILVYADLSRWEAQNRFRRNESSNLGVQNNAVSAGLQYKRAFFIDWRVCDRWKKGLMRQWHFLLDTNDPENPKIADADAVRAGLRHAVTRPFRVVPFFDPGPWGGQWMKEVCDLDRSVKNFAWCFDCVPEENSLLLTLGGQRVEIPAIDLVFDQPRALLGDAVHARFGDEFPIRFDFLDTMGGGNLSFQVHPLTEYIQNEFGMHYTQDESYYLLDAGGDACVYLGLKEGVDRSAMIRDLVLAQQGGPEFDADRYANRWPAKKHDHFLIPAGTVHCSGANSMVLEISATPYIFTFKLWDWGRLGLDGIPRPIHLDHGQRNIQWNRTTKWVQRGLINVVQPLGEGDGWREERTGLHKREFIETRRHWFTKRVAHHTNGGVNVLNLVEGEEAIVESPGTEFEPFVLHYAETFIVPAAVGAYTIRPWGQSEGKQCATIKAFVRT
jgi:mannose-6-phosphate isomerase class I